MNKLSFFLLLFLSSLSYIYPQDLSIDSTLITNNLHKIYSIDNSQEHEDLDFLKSELENVQIMMLGEQAHGDGSTFLAKTRIIKYLHENLDFDVLVFESGLMDVYRVWTMIQEGDDHIDVFDNGIFPIWTNSKQTKELFNYILKQSKTDDPLYIAGFDMQPTGSAFTPDQRWEELNAYLVESIDFKEDSYPLFSKVFKNIRVVFSPEFQKKDLQLLIEEIEKLRNLVTQKDKSIQGKITSTYLRNYLKTIILYKTADLQVPTNTPHVFNIRDREMANNFIFLKEELFPNKKIIVWGANSHLGYGRGFLEDFLDREASAKGMIPMGQYLKIDYQDNLYSLAFTSSGGKIGSLRGSTRELPPAHELSLERLLSDLGYENAYLSLRDNSIKSNRFATRIFGHAEMNGKWGQMFDGIFFIRNMLPNEKRKE
jgi:erythromycin esterase